MRDIAGASDDVDVEVGNASIQDAPSSAVVPDDFVQPPAAVEHSSADELSSSSSDSDLLFETQPVVEPEKCSASGPGLTGGIAGQPARLTISARNAAGNTVTTSHGAHVVVHVVDRTTKSSTTPENSYIAVDNGNGTYTAWYTLPAKGNYELRVEINGQEIGGSPFPVYCDNPAEGVPESGASSVGTSLGAQAVRFGVNFNVKDKESLRRTVLVGGLSPHVTEEALRIVFAPYGRIKSITFPATNVKSFSLIEFNVDTEADAALKLAGITVQSLGVLRLENALQASSSIADKASISKESVLANAAERARRLAMEIRSDSRNKRDRSKSQEESVPTKATEDKRHVKRKPTSEDDLVDELDALLKEIEAA
jgi:hypothetical protein